MADAKGLYAAENLKVTIKVFPSGSTALQSFQAGQGDIVATGDLPSVNYWATSDKNYRMVDIIARNTQMFAAALNDVKTPQDLEGKTVATRVGSTGSWFISVFLQKNNIPAEKVKVINLDTQVMPSALCGKDIAAFFIWEPFITRTKEICPNDMHTLSSADGYVSAYSVIGARPAWLNSPEGSDAAIRFLRATLKGKAIAEKDYESVAAYGKEHFGYKDADINQGWKANERVEAFDKKFYDDYCSLAKWMQSQGILKINLDFSQFIWAKGLQTIDAKLVDQPPGSC
jgi:ABC-type nitrate/sulfonate/bicarbonate transport system substrate-binding protein